MAGQPNRQSFFPFFCIIGSDAANHVVSTPHRLRSSEIPKPLSVSLVVMPPRHHISFFLGFRRPDQNHWIKRMANTRSTTYDSRNCAGLEDLRRDGRRTKKSKKNRPGPDGRDASRWYGRIRVQKLTLSVLNCAHALGQSFHDGQSLDQIAPISL